MAYTLSTNVFTQILEATDFSRTVNIVQDPVDPLDPLISSIVVTKVNDFNSSLNIITDSSSFTIAGQYNNNFSKTLTYLDEKKESITLTSKTVFDDLPSDYFMVVEYLASFETSFTAIYSVSVNGITIGTVTQQVNNNYTPGKDALISAVAGGQV